MVFTIKNRIRIRIFLLVLAGLLYGSIKGVKAQTDYFTYNDIELGLYSYLKPKQLNGLQWYGRHVIYYSNDTVYKVEANGESRYFFTLEELNKILIDSELPKISGLKYLKAHGDEVLTLQYMNYLVRLVYPSPGILSITKLSGKAENIEIHYKTGKVAYTVGSNLFLGLPGADHVQLTFDSIAGISNGVVVHRNEFGVEDGSFWSADGNFLAYYKKDERMVSDYPLVNIDSRVADLKQIPYPMAGMKSEEVKVYVYSMKTGETVELNTAGDPEQYLTNISWSNDEKYVFIQQLNRAQDRMKLLKYDAQSGERLSVLFEERHKKYVEPYAPLKFIDDDSGNFLYQSRTNGYKHIFLYNAKKDKLKLITKGDWEVNKLLGYHNHWVYYTSSEVSSLERHLYKVNIQTEEKVQLSSEAGVHTVSFSPDYSAFIDTYSSTSQPKVQQIVDDHGERTVLHKAQSPLGEYKLGEVRMGTIKAADNKTDINYKMVLPVGFDSTQKYPLVYYVYGGPHVQLIRNKWLGRTDFWFQYLAQHGVVGITIDPRGSAN